MEALGAGEGGLETLAQEAWGRGCSAIDLILERGLRSAQDLRAAQAQLALRVFPALGVCLAPLDLLEAREPPALLDLQALAK